MDYRQSYLELFEELDGLSVVDAETTTADVIVDFALSIAEVLQGLSLVTVAAQELRSRSLGVLAASDGVALAHALGVGELLALVVGKLIRALPLLVDATQDPEGSKSSVVSFNSFSGRGKAASLTCHPWS